MTVAEVDAAFVDALGLRDVAARRRTRPARRGPPAAAGRRARGRRPQSRSAPQLPGVPRRARARPSDTAIRIDGAYATWKVLREQGWEQPYVHDKLAGLWIPPVPAAVAGVLQRAVSEIGSPYVWGGSSLEDGGFDCSGLVIYALGGDESWLGGRTTHDWARAHRKDRLSRGRAAGGRRRACSGAADAARARRRSITRRLYLGNGWFIDSASQGVSLDRLDTDYYSRRFAFGLRPPAV